MTKVQLHVMLLLHNVRIVPSNLRKNQETIKYEKSIVTSDIGTTQCKDGTIKCEKK